VVYSFDLVAGSQLTATWRLPNGRSTSDDRQGPLAETRKFPLFYLNGSPLPSGLYTFELRTQSRVLARATFTRRCS
jgi:hypothetical protein